MTYYAFYIFAFKKLTFDTLQLPLPAKVRGTPTPHGGGHLTELIGYACDDSKILLNNVILVDSDIMSGTSPDDAKNQLDGHLGADLATLKTNSLNWVVYIFS
jgi:hypothetical protein